MSDIYLDQTGLAYFWSKLKAWASGLFVHRTGAETVHDLKAFASARSSNPVNGIAVQSLDIDKGVAPSVDCFCSLGLFDKDFSAESASSEADVLASRLATLEYAARSTGRVDLQFYIQDPDSVLNDGLRFRIGYEADRTPFFVGPSTKDNPYSGEIITYDWLPKDTRLVHTTGDETIGGSKIFGNWTRFRGSGAALSLEDTSAVLATNSDSQWRILARDKNLAEIGAVRWHWSSTGQRLWQAWVKNTSGGNSVIQVGWDANGIAFATCPSTSTSRSNAADIVTRDFIPNDTRIVHTTGNEDIGGYKTFSNSPTVYLWEGDNTIQAMRINATKGTNPTGSGKYATVAAFEKSGNLYVANRIAALHLYVDTGGNTYASLTAYKYVSGATNASDFSCICAPDGTSYQRSTSIRPLTNNAYSLGTGTYKYTAVYATNGSIQTSDERFKHDIGFIPDAVLDVWESVEWKQFRMLDSVQKKGRASARVHVGAIAQQIEKAFADAGLDAAAYGFFCHDEWEQTQEVRDGDGRVVVPYNPAGDSYALRYDEALCIEAAYLRRENARLKKRVADLEERLAALELKIS